MRNGVEMDLVTHDILKFFTMLLKRNGYVLEQLHSPLVVQTSSEHDELKAIAHGCVTRYHTTAITTSGLQRPSGAYLKKNNRQGSNRCCMSIACC